MPPGGHGPSSDATSWGPFADLLLDGGGLIQFADLPVDQLP
jgi:hypothetical protein